MKKLIFSLSMLFLAGGILAQSAAENYAQTMSQTLNQKYELTKSETSSVYDIFLADQTKLEGIMHLRTEETAAEFEIARDKIKKETNAALQNAIGSKMEAYEMKRKEQVDLNKKAGLEKINKIDDQ